METKSIKSKDGMIIDIPDFLLEEIKKATTDFLMITPSTRCVQCDAQARKFDGLGWTYTKYAVEAKEPGEDDPIGDALRSFAMGLNNGSRQLPFVIDLQDESLENYWAGFNPDPKRTSQEQQSLAS